MKLVILVLSLLVSTSAFAQSIFNDDVCPVVESSAAQVSAQMLVSPQPGRLAAYGAFGLSCQDLKTLQKADQYATIILTSAYTAAAANPSLTAELAAAGLTTANPAVASVVVVGGIGVATIKIVLLATLDQCEQQDRDELKQSIIDELAKKYDLHPAGSDVQLQINN